MQNGTRTGLNGEESKTFQQGKKESEEKVIPDKNFLEPLRARSNLQPINCTIQFNVMLGLHSHEEEDERE